MIASILWLNYEVQRSWKHANKPDGKREAAKLNANHKENGSIRNAKQKKKTCNPLGRKFLITLIIHHWDNYCETKRRASNKLVDGRNRSLSQVGEHISLGICVSLERGTHITKDTCFPGGRIHITRDICFPGGGTHITRDTCFPGGGKHITRDMCFPR